MKMQLVLVAAIITMVLLACEKSKNQAAAPNSTWMMDGDTFKGRALYVYHAISPSLEGYTDKSAGGQMYGDYVKVIFGYTIDKPAVNAFYTISGGSVFPTNVTECLVQVGISYCCDRWVSNKAGEKVTITVSSAGKLTATFSNITLTNGTGSFKSVSGTLIEQ